MFFISFELKFVESLNAQHTYCVNICRVNWLCAILQIEFSQENHWISWVLLDLFNNQHGNTLSIYRYKRCKRYWKVSNMPALSSISNYINIIATYSSDTNKNTVKVLEFIRYYGYSAFLIILNTRCILAFWVL